MKAPAPSRADAGRSPDEERAHRTRRANVLATYIVIVLTLIAIGLAVTFRLQSVHTDDALQTSLLEGCARGNTLRLAVTHFVDVQVNTQVTAITTQLAQSKSIPPKFFPSIPPKRFAQLQRQAADQAHDSIATLRQADALVQAALHPLDCQAIYGDATG